MRVVGAANKYISDTEPWKLQDDPERRDTVLHTALQVVSDANTLLTPFLPHAAQQVHEALGGTGVWAAQPEIREVSEDGGAGLSGDHGRLRRRAGDAGRPGRSPRERRWSSRPRCSPSSTRSWARPARTGLRSSAEASTAAARSALARHCPSP